MERYSARLSLESNLGKAIKIGASLQPTFIIQNRTSTNTSREDVIGVANWANPVLSPYDANGNLIPYLTSPQSKYHSAWSFANPLFVLRETAQTQRQFQNLGLAFVEWSIISYLGRINYGFKDRYLLTATLRSDGSSRFGSQSRYATFSSLGLLTKPG